MWCEKNYLSVINLKNIIIIWIDKKVFKKFIKRDLIDIFISSLAFNCGSKSNCIRDVYFIMWINNLKLALLSSILSVKIKPLSLRV